MKITPRMVDALRAFGDYLETYGRPPTAAEVAVRMKIGRPRAYQLLLALVEAGRLERDDGLARGLRLVRVHVGGNPPSNPAATGRPQ